MKSLTDFEKEIVAIYKEYEKQGTKPWTYSIATQDLSYQVGSLAKLILQKKGERFAHGKEEKEIDQEIAEELADIFAEILFIAHELDLDLESAWEKMVERDYQKIEKRSHEKS